MFLDDKMTEDQFKEWVESHDTNKKKLDEKYIEKTKNLKVCIVWFLWLLSIR